MRYMGKSTVLFWLLLAVFSLVGCSEESTAPDISYPLSTGLKHIWSQSFGDGETQNPLACAVDASGNMIVAGIFHGSVDFGGDVLVEAGTFDIFVAKFGPDGTHLWSKSFGDGNYQECPAAAVDASGNVILAGLFYGTVDFGGGALTSAGEEEIFVAKFGADGTHLWSKRFGGEGYEGAYAVAVDASGNVIVTGHVWGEVDFGGGVLVSSGGMDIFVAKFNADGDHIWSALFGDGSNQFAKAVAVDASGNVFVTGYFAGTVDFGGDVLTDSGLHDVFMVKLGADGAHIWSKSFGDENEQIAKSVAVDASGNVVVTGDFKGTVDFGGSALSSAGDDDIFVAKFGAQGTHIWSKRFGDVAEQNALAVALDSSGNVIVAGNFEGNVDFGGSVLASAGNEDIFMAKFGADGLHLRSRRFGDGDYQRARAVSTDFYGKVIVTGHFNGTVDFGGDELTSAGNQDIFVVKFTQ